MTLPLNGRNPLHLIGLVPGVVGHSAEATASGGTSTQYINGDRGRGITTTQDGIDIGDPVIPRGELTNAPVNPDAVEQFRLISSNAEGRIRAHRRRTGRDGDQERHQSSEGHAYEFMRQTALDSNSYFNKLRGLPKEQLSRNQFGATLGGPIKRDRAFFFVNYDGMRRTQDTSQVGDRADRVAAQRALSFRDGAVRGRDGGRESPRLRRRDRQPAGARLVLQLRDQRSRGAGAGSRGAERDAQVPAAAQRLHGWGRAQLRGLSLELAIASRPWIP